MPQLIGQPSGARISGARLAFWWCPDSMDSLSRLLGVAARAVPARRRAKPRQPANRRVHRGIEFLGPTPFRAREGVISQVRFKQKDSKRIRFCACGTPRFWLGNRLRSFCWLRPVSVRSIPPFVESKGPQPPGIRRIRVRLIVNGDLLGQKGVVEGVSQGGFGSPPHWRKATKIRPSTKEQPSNPNLSLPMSIVKQLHPKKHI
jgi:hypothetical protein